LTTGDIEDATGRVEPHHLPQAKELLAARRVLKLVVALSDGKKPGHAAF